MRLYFGVTASSLSAPALRHAPSLRRRNRSIFFSMPSPTTKKAVAEQLRLLRGEHLLDGLLVVLDEGLAEQRDFRRGTCSAPPSTILATISAGLPDSLARAARMSRSRATTSAGTSALRQVLRLGERDVHRDVLARLRPRPRSRPARRSAAVHVLRQLRLRSACARSGGCVMFSPIFCTSAWRCASTPGIGGQRRDVGRDSWSPPVRPAPARRRGSRRSWRRNRFRS